MKYFIVYAHPEPRSLNGSLKDHVVEKLRASGHEVRVSDLYAMRWKAVADADDFPARDPSERLVYHRDSGHAYQAKTQAPEIAAEQEKLLWADVVVLQFPLWWFSMPAILKGWFDRVFAHGFAIGVPKPGEKRKWARYGEGTLAGRRAIVATTLGSREAQFGARGVNGPIEDILFPITHGMLFYTGLAVVPSFVAYRTVRLSDEEFATLAGAYERRLLTIGETEPIPFRAENSDDFTEDNVLRADIEGEGFALHRRRGR